MTPTLKTRLLLVLPFVIAVTLFLSVDLFLHFNSHRIDFVLTKRILDFKLEDIKKDTPTQMDVLAIGSSRTLYGYKTDAFEALGNPPLNAYNLGLSGGDFYIFQHTLEHFVTDYGKPNYVILDVSEHLFRKHQLIESYYNIFYLRTLIQKNPALADDIYHTSALSWKEKKEFTFARLSSVYRYRFLFSISRIRKLIFERRKRPPAEKAYYQGWLSKPIRSGMKKGDKVLQEFVWRRFSENTQGLDTDHFDTHKIHHFLTYCKQQHIPVVLVRWPYHPLYEKKFDEQPVNQLYTQELQTLTDEFNIPLIDLNDTTRQLTQEQIKVFFRDPDHLSFEGADYFTRKLHSLTSDLVTESRSLD